MFYQIKGQFWGRGKGWASGRTLGKISFRKSLSESKPNGGFSLGRIYFFQVCVCITQMSVHLSVSLSFRTVSLPTPQTLKRTQAQKSQFNKVCKHMPNFK